MKLKGEIFCPVEFEDESCGGHGRKVNNVCLFNRKNRIPHILLHSYILFDKPLLN